jgi:GAF domain-containing protein
MTKIVALQIEPDKSDIYASVIQQLDWMFRHEPDMLANLANCAAIMHMHLGFSWVGFYFRRGDDLVLGPFQGHKATARMSVLPVPHGICGHAAALGRSVMLNDVADFHGHIASSPATKSAVVIPLVLKGRTELVINVEAEEINAFDDEDQRGLENIMRLIERHYFA